MIRYLGHNEIDKARWDECLDNLPACKPYPYSWYLDIMVPHWEALVDDDYDSVFPVPAFRKYGFYYIATPVFLQQLGIYSPDNNLSFKIDEYLAFMPEFYRLIDMCIAQDPSGSDFRIGIKDNHELDLSKSYALMWEGFSSDCRRNIRLSLNERFTVEENVSPSEVIGLFRRNSGRGLRGVKNRDYRKLEMLMQYCLANEKGRLVGISNVSGQLIYGLFAVLTPGSVTLLFTATSDESRSRRAGYFVLNSLIEEYSGSNRILDFAGSSIPTVADYNRSFGCVTVPYYHIYRNRLPWPVKIFK
ncbi:MAG: hypothetical protein RBS37_10705 [Bacteroidales bacterium]|jgi:hypothetical protein|nr:hypothetical protein [Bacteroidales bacterium]